MSYFAALASTQIVVPLWPRKKKSTRTLREHCLQHVRTMGRGREHEFQLLYKSLQKPRGRKTAEVNIQVRAKVNQSKNEAGLGPRKNRGRTAEDAARIQNCPKLSAEVTASPAEVNVWFRGRDQGGHLSIARLYRISIRGGWYGSGRPGEAR